MDTADKRASAVAGGLSFRVVFPVADGALNQGDRQQTAYVYRGILADAPGAGDADDFWLLLLGVGR